MPTRSEVELELSTGDLYINGELFAVGADLNRATIWNRDNVTADISLNGTYADREIYTSHMSSSAAYSDAANYIRTPDIYYDSEYDTAESAVSSVYSKGRTPKRKNTPKELPQPDLVCDNGGALDKFIEGFGGKS